MQEKELTVQHKLLSRYTPEYLEELKETRGKIMSDKSFIDWNIDVKIAAIQAKIKIKELEIDELKEELKNIIQTLC